MGHLPRSPESTKLTNNREHPITKEQQRVNQVREGMRARIGALFGINGRVFRVGESVTYQTSPSGKHYQGVVSGITKSGKIMLIRTGTKKALLFPADKLNYVHQSAESPLETPESETRFPIHEVAKKHQQVHPERVKRYKKAS